MSEEESALDATAQWGGKLFIWWKICGAVIVTVIATGIAVFLGIFYRRGWHTSLERVETVDCTDGTQQRCSQSHHQSTCTTVQIHACKLEVQGGAFPTMSHTYTSDPPKQGDSISVYYDPSKPRGTATLSPGIPHTGLIAVVGLLVALASAGWGYFLFSIRNNKMAQRIGAGVAVFDMMSN